MNKKKLSFKPFFIDSTSCSKTVENFLYYSWREIWTFDWLNTLGYVLRKKQFENPFCSNKDLMNF